MLNRLICLAALLAGLCCVRAVDRGKFRTCHDTGFCKRNRVSQDVVPIKAQYELASVAPMGLGQFSATVGKTVSNTVLAPSELSLKVSFYSSGAIRVTLGEVDNERWKPTDILVPRGLELAAYKQLDPTTPQGLASIPSPIKANALYDASSYVAFAFEDQGGGEESSYDRSQVLIVHKSPLKFELYKDDVLLVTANDRSLLHFETTSPSNRKLQASEDTTKAAEAEGDRHGGKTITGYWEDGLAIYEDGTREERRLEEADDATTDASVFKGDSFGGHPDSMKLGPKSVGIDFAFPYAQDVYGIPEHTSPLSLPTTQPGSSGAKGYYDQPYRMYTLDVFEYELDNTMALYGTIPLMLAHALSEKTGQGVTSGVFWFNPSETFIDISDGGEGAVEGEASGVSKIPKPFKQSHWISESGEVDFFLLSGPTFKDVYRQYTRLTGTQQLPPMFSLGYHQCRWNYRDEKDVAAVEAKFEELDYPYDVLWLDIEHTDGKRYFTWDKSVFPKPIEMQQNLTRHGRKMVTIVDPHIKRDNNYYIHKEATAKGLYIKDKNGGDFDGWCWPGQSSYMDFTDPKVRQWWAEQFSLSKYIGSTMDLFTWNDMNEPSVFNGPEVSMPKDAKNLAGVEHREWHNLYGMYMQMATQLGLIIRSPPNAPAERPFVLTRSFWAGSQRWGAMWTGDNTATWDHLKIAAPMLLSINMGGLSFAGADVGGFFGEPSAELFTRWYQAGAFTPFFRGHAHHDTKRREPWVYGEPYTSILRETAMLRYTLLPVWYTAFYEGYSTGMPVMRPMLMNYPSDARTFKMDDQWMVGDSLLVKPVTAHGHTSTKVYLPGSEDWFDLLTLQRFKPTKEGEETVVEAPLGKIPVFIRGGVILPRKMRLRRSSKLMFYDPYTLVITPDSAGSARGSLYMDDEHSLAHEQAGAFALRSLVYSTDVASSSASLSCSDSAATATSSSSASSSSAAAVSSSGAISSPGAFDAPNTVERIVIAGQTKSPKSVSIIAVDAITKAETTTSQLLFLFDAASETVTIKKPDAVMMQDWRLTVYF